MRNRKLNLLSMLFIIMFSFIDLTAQSIFFELGASKHFVPEAEHYEQPNLEIQVRHRFANNFEYLIGYNNIKNYSDLDHEILPSNGDEAELYSRHINGLDFAWNFIPFLIQKDFFGIAFGPSIRVREEIITTSCQETNGGWMECLMEGYKTNDLGFNVQAYANYIFWKNFGICGSLNEKFFNAGTSTFSINFGLTYKLVY